MEDGVIDSAKQDKSLSRIPENYLKSITTQEETKEELSPKVAKLMGAIKLPEDFDYKKELVNVLSKKYK